MLTVAYGIMLSIFPAIETCPEGGGQQIYSNFLYIPLDADLLANIQPQLGLSSPSFSIAGLFRTQEARVHPSYRLPS